MTGAQFHENRSKLRWFWAVSVAWALVLIVVVVGPLGWWVCGMDTALIAACAVLVGAMANALRVQAMWHFAPAVRYELTADSLRAFRGDDEVVAVQLCHVVGWNLEMRNDVLDLVWPLGWRGWWWPPDRPVLRLLVMVGPCADVVVFPGLLRWLEAGVDRLEVELTARLGPQRAYGFNDFA